MRRARHLALLLGFPLGALAQQPGAAQVVAQGAAQLRFEHPAADCEREGLPIGNGAQGAMITGGPGSRGYDSGLPARSLVLAVPVGSGGWLVRDMQHDVPVPCSPPGDPCRFDARPGGSYELRLAGVEPTSGAI